MQFLSLCWIISHKICVGHSQQKLMIFWMFSPSWIRQNFACWMGISLHFSVCERWRERHRFYAVCIECASTCTMFDLCVTINKEPMKAVPFYACILISQSFCICLLFGPYYLWVCVSEKEREREEVKRLPMSVLQGSRLPVSICLSLWSHGPPATRLTVSHQTDTARRANVLMWSLNEVEELLQPGAAGAHFWLNVEGLNP